jgi:polyphenol oxidase
MMHNQKIFLGDKKTAVAQVTTPGHMRETRERLHAMAKEHGFEKFLFPLQVHGMQGWVIQKNNALIVQSFEREADWIATNVPGIGIGVLTADCVPILVHDPITNVVGAIHAGWRGAVDGVVLKALEGMEQVFGTQPHDLNIFIGPHARTCCYTVDQKFYDTVMQKPFGKNAWHENETGLCFDLSHSCLEQLAKAGVLTDNITNVATCTVCTPAYCSYRREKDAALRNVSWIGL